MGTYATLVDVKARYDKTIPADLEPFVQAHLDDANLLLDSLVPSLSARAGTVGGLARMVVVRAVLRVLRNPDGFKGEHAGEYGYYFDANGASGQVAFPPEDLALLEASGSRGRVRSVGLDDDALSEPTRSPSPWSTRQDVVSDDWGDITYNYAQQAEAG
jgi:hypothetical protein